MTEQAQPEWPKSPPDAATLIRYCAGRGLWASSKTWALIDAGAFDDDASPELRTRYSLMVAQIIHNHDVVLALKEMQQIDPAKADALADRMWRAADAGDSYGEWLWRWAEEAGLDAEAIDAEGRTEAPRG